MKDHIDATLAWEYLDPFPRSILEDYVVTDEEWAEARSRYFDCMAMFGLEGFVSDGPILSYGPTEADQDIVAVDYADREEGLTEAFRLSSECAGPTIDFVGAPYFSLRNNPDGASVPEQLRRCFAEQGILGLEGLSDDEVEEYVNRPDILSDPEVGYCYKFAWS